MKRELFIVLLSAALAACQEKLTSPGGCPELCPSDNLVIEDVVLEARLDSTYTGFLGAGEGTRLLLSNGLGGEDFISVVRFARRGDSITVRDTLRPFAVDSVLLTVNVEGRDSAATGLAVEVYKLPASIPLDASTTHAEVEAALLPERLIRSVPVPDDLASGALRMVFAGAELDEIAFAPEDDKVLRLAYRLVAPAPTGLLLASSATGSTGPAFITFTRVALSDTTIRQPLPRIVQFQTSLDATPSPAPSPDLLTVGGAPSSRAILRFALPPRVRDSAEIIRATLQLVPVAPFSGMTGDSAALDTRGVFSDLGAKSPRISSSEALIVRERLIAGSSDTLFVEVTPVVRLWAADPAPPAALFLALEPEASSFTLAQFGSSRTPNARPTLRITYALPYPFEVQ
ncbi:MAG TPA: hypothetical protein VFT04_05270 [Gemmatimonadales bacterium]|nr:hypothetical protein [Gemmatimonadales bacterium]